MVAYTTTILGPCSTSSSRERRHGTVWLTDHTQHLAHKQASSLARHLTIFAAAAYCTNAGCSLLTPGWHWLVSNRSGGLTANLALVNSMIDPEPFFPSSNNHTVLKTVWHAAPFEHASRLGRLQARLALPGQQCLAFALMGCAPHYTITSNTPLPALHVPKLAENNKSLRGCRTEILVSLGAHNSMINLGGSKYGVGGFFFQWSVGRS